MKASDSPAYQRHKEANQEARREQSAHGRDIGKLPPIKNKRRRKKTETDFRSFCETYLAELFPLAWSPDHLTAIAKIEAAVLRGELFAFAMPRGSGKTTLCESACLWAMLHGHCQFLVLIGADQAISSSMLDSLKAQVETNDVLLEDFPEAIYPVRRLERIAQRANGQTYRGEPTKIEWTADTVTMPWIPGSPSAGAAVRVAGITGRIRGLKHTRPDGTTIRPSLVLIDDPQTDESASSPSQVATREKILSGAILGLAGPGQKIAGLCTITVIRPDDLADRLLNRQRHPSWQGERTKLVYDWPKEEALWSQYAELRREGQRSGEGVGAANEFYATHREQMDAGSRVAWPERKNDDELSAIQHAWNLRIDRGEAAFMAEYQNDPQLDSFATDRLDRATLDARVTSLGRNVPPINHHHLTAFIDVQGKLLYWLVASWNDSFGGQVIRYGTYPDQHANFFEAASVKQTLARACGSESLEACLQFGLEKTCDEILSKNWYREDGAAMRVGQLMIDANWSKSTEIVRTFCRQSKYAGVILPSHGRGIGASGKPLTDTGRQRGDRLGLNWRVGQLQTKQRSCTFDTNFWKSFVAARLLLPPGDPESIMVHKGNHEFLWEHWTAEHPIPTEARGRVVEEWRIHGNRWENHWWDCIVGAAVAASMLGVSPIGTETGTRHRKKVTLPVGSNGRKRIEVKRL